MTASKRTRSSPSQVESNCDHCGKVIFVEPARLRRFRRHFCDRRCQYAWQSKNRRGPANPLWKGDDALARTKRVRARRLFPHLGTCERCGVEPAVDRHHVDGDPGHNEPENIRRLCRKCHMFEDGRSAALVGLSSFGSLIRWHGRDAALAITTSQQSATTWYEVPDRERGGEMTRSHPSLGSQTRGDGRPDRRSAAGRRQPMTATEKELLDTLVEVCEILTEHPERIKRFDVDEVTLIYWGLVAGEQILERELGR